LNTTVSIRLLGISSSPQPMSSPMHFMAAVPRTYLFGAAVGGAFSLLGLVSYRLAVAHRPADRRREGASFGNISRRFALASPFKTLSLTAVGHIFLIPSPFPHFQVKLGGSVAEKYSFVNSALWFISGLH
jgi:hypothetical protein